MYTATTGNSRCRPRKGSIMALALILFLLILNFGISWWNAYVCGQMWADSKVAGGYLRFLTWCAAIMSACGFTSVYSVVLAVTAGATGLLEPEYVRVIMELGYVAIIFPVISIGFVFMVQSWVEAYRERTLLSGGVAAWNTFAQIHNTYDAVKNLPGILGHLGEVFKGASEDSDGKGKLFLIAIALAAVAILGGILTTTAIVRSTARKVAQNTRVGQFQAA